jgi:hypothetical protein
LFSPIQGYLHHHCHHTIPLHLAWCFRFWLSSLSPELSLLPHPRPHHFYHRRCYRRHYHPHRHNYHPAFVIDSAGNFDAPRRCSVGRGSKSNHPILQPPDQRTSAGRIDCLNGANWQRKDDSSLSALSWLLVTHLIIYNWLYLIIHLIIYPQCYKRSPLHHLRRCHLPRRCRRRHCDHSLRRLPSASSFHHHTVTITIYLFP